MVFTPPGGGAGLPMVVFLHGTVEDVLDEARRDQLLPRVATGQLSVVYPVGVDRAWDVGGGCCTSEDQVDRDDVAFVRYATAAAVALVRPDGDRLSLMGYSSGGKLAWRLVCEDPRPFAALATYGAAPTTDCPSRGRRVSVLVGSGGRDEDEPVGGRAADSRGPHPSVDDVTDVWRTRDDCSPRARDDAVAGVDRRSWTCAAGRSVESLVWPLDDHLLPELPDTPRAGTFGELAWAFVSGTAGTPTATPAGPSGGPS